MTGKTTVNFGVVSELTVANETVNLILEKTQDRNVAVYRGGMIAGQRLLVVALLEELIPELDAPDSIQNLAITKMAVELRPDKGSYAFEAAIENAWSITLDSGPTLSIQKLAISVLSVKPPASQNGNQPNTSESLSQQRKLAFEGLFELFGGEFAVQVIHQFSSINGKIASQWGFSAIAQNISITEIIKAFGFSQDKLDEYGLGNLEVSLAFALQQTRYKENNTQIEKSRYSFRGELDWDTQIALVPGEETLQINAAIQINKTSSNKLGGTQSRLTGAIAGTVKASIPFFDTLKLSVIYTFTKTTSTSSSSRSSQTLAQRTGELIFQLQISTLLLSAVYTNINNRKILQFSISLVDGKNPKVGDLIAYIVSLYDPSIADFELDPPWDEFARQEIALDQFSLEIDLTQKTVTISYRATLNVLIAKVSNIGLSYQYGTNQSSVNRQRNQARTASNKKVAIALNLSIPGQPQQRVQWDPVNENPPAVPSRKAPIFDLKFLAIGQRVAFAPEIVQQARTIEQFTNVMRQTLVPLPPIKRRQNPLTALQQALPSAVSSDPSQPISFSGQPIIFSAESGWLIGAQFIILGAFDLSVIFNDPFIYGLRISLSGPLVQIFAGLEFEILYRRISDTVGVYRTELILPDAMRYLQFGAVSITLPVVAIEIYTNGDFGIDVGFPWGGDFSRSIAVNVGIFLGVGGFYFNKLSAETATSVPAITNGNFNPVLEFGIGLKVGLGKIIQKGPLRAEMSITIHGLLQGVFATFNPTDTRQNKVTYYRVQGGVAIVGRLYGVVDFKVIQVDLEVLVSITVLFIVEVYKAIQVALVAKVSVRASIKIAFIRIRFKFNLTIRQEFVLGSDSKTPWQLAATSAGAMAVNLPVFTSSSRAIPVEYLRTERIRNTGTIINTNSGESANKTEKRSLRWENNQTAIKLAKPDKIREQTWVDNKLRLDIYFQPGFTRTESGVSGVSLLFIENSIPPDETTQVDKDTDFDELVKALLKWVIYAASTDEERNTFTNDTGIKIDSYNLTLEILEEIYRLFTDYLETAPVDDFWEPLIRFLEANFIFAITDRPIEQLEISGTIFPMFPQLQMELNKGSETVPEKINFESYNKYSPAQIKKIQTDFQSLNHNHNQTTDEGLRRFKENDATRDLTIAELLFIDYFTLIIRSVLQQGIDYIRDSKEGVNNGEISVVGLLDQLSANSNNTDSYPLQDLAGMTSRFLLHGLRLPIFENSTDTQINGQEPVYVATGQQFQITVTRTPPETEGDNEIVKIIPNEIKLLKPESIAWIRLIDYPKETNNSESLTPELNSNTASQNKIETIKQLDAAITSNILPKDAPILAEIYDNIHQRYTIRQKTYWTLNTNKNILWELPLGLLNYLKSKSETSRLSLFYHQQAQAGEAINPEEISSEYTWATKLTLEIRRVSQSNGSEFLPTVYAIEGIDPTSEELLRDILETNAQPITLTLLYLDDSGDSKVLTRHTNSEVLILKTNLSVGSNENYTVKLDSTTTFRPFLELIQESSVVRSGGYYLNYSSPDQKGLPDDLFADGETAKVTLLMTFNDDNNDAASYNNCLNIPFDHPQISMINSVSEIFAESSETTPVLRIPAGNLGFKLVRDAIEAEDNDTAIDEIQNLYQLLNYQLPNQISTHFQTDQDYLPIGPIEEDETSKTWRYEKILPVYALTREATEPSTALPKILKDSINPYYGIGENFQLDFQWQDIYGNRLRDDGKLNHISQKLGYFDPILGVNQWPSVGESYTITKKDDQTANLTLELVLDQSKYIPTPTNSWVEALDKIKTDRATYQQIYYQVHDSNLTFTVSTSIIPTWSQDLQTVEERAIFTDFVDNIYKYLVTLEYLKEFPYVVSDDSETLESVANEYSVNLGDLADINSNVSGLFSNSQNIQIPVGVRVSSSDSLNTIATKLIKNQEDQQNKVEEIVKEYATTADLLVVDQQIVLDGENTRNYTVESGDTFESIAIAYLAKLEDELIETNLQTIAQALDTTQILADGVLIKGLQDPQKYVTVNATLEEIAYGVLKLENADLDLDFEQILTERINDIVTANESTRLVPEIIISALNETTQTEDTFSTLRDRLLTQPNYANQTPENILKEVAQAVRELEIFPTNTTLTILINPKDQTPFNIEIKIITNKTWEAIASAFPNSETVDTIILANAQRQDLLIEGVTIESLNHTIQPQDSLYHIALNDFVANDSRSVNVLRSDIIPEVDTLNYPIAEANSPQRTLAYLTQQLHLKTNRHRTVLETVKAVGNISNILSENAITNSLSIVADAVSNITGLFGTEDVILADVLFEYTVTNEDSFDQMIQIAANRDQILTDQTTAADIAIKNPNLRLESNVTLYIRDRFTLDTNSAQNTNHLAIASSPDQATSLDTFSRNMGTGISPAAVAIANQSLIGLLTTTVSLQVFPIIANLSAISAADLQNLERVVAEVLPQSSTLQIRSTETLYTLKLQLEQKVTVFQNNIEAAAEETQQKIGAISAIYEQLTFAGANRTALGILLNSSVSDLDNLLFDENNNLNPQFQQSTVHQSPSEPINVLQAINNLKNPPIDRKIEDVLQASLDSFYRMYELSCLKTAVDLLEKRSQHPITVAEIGIAIKDESELIAPKKDWIIPPGIANTTLNINIQNQDNRLLYPTDLLFSVNVQVEMWRNKDLIHPGSVAEAQSISAYFSPKTIALTSSGDQENIATDHPENSTFKDRLASLDPFAKMFEAALPNLKLAVGRNATKINNINPQNSDTLWAVHLGKTGIHYNINETFPFFFSAAPLSNTLLSGEVKLYTYNQEDGLNQTSTETVRVDAVDINGLARTYLQAIEDILKPENAVTAVNNTDLKPKIERILKVKESLADTISNTVTPILKTDLDTTSEDYLNRQQLAVAALRKEFLTNLANAYDIETLVQYNVDVAIADGYQWLNNDIPCLSGQPTIIGAHYTDSQKIPNSTSSETEKKALLQSLDFSLSPAKIALDSSTNNGKSTLTFFFNTQTPQRYEDIAVNLMYQVNELQYNIDTQNSTSSWLNFVLPLENEPNNIGDVQIPIPLRDFPLPPSLITHKAVPDPDSFSGEILSAEDIRDWNYVFLYEHPDVAQDTIECRIEYNGLSKLTISDVTLKEDEQTAIFTVTLSPPSDKIVTVDYQTQDGTAQQPGDYIATNGTLEFPPSETTQDIQVTVNSDDVVENNETFTIILSNAVNAEIADPVGIGTIIDTTNTIDPLLDTLVRFNNLYPLIVENLQSLETEITEETVKALEAFVILAEEVARSWKIWKPIAIAQASRQTVHYNIDENLSVDQQTKTVTITPTNNLSIPDQQVLEIDLPGYQLDAIQQNGEPTTSPSIPYTSLEFDFKKLADATGIETFGESALPDRKVTVTNLDILEYQNAWGAIRLARNKNLIDGMETNPAFIFQTPEIRFKNRITPLIVNDKRWDIAALGNSRTKTLEQHLEALFTVLLPEGIQRPYDLRIACQYAFSLASNQDELLAKLPVLLTPRFTVQKTESATTMLEVTQQLRENIVTEMQDWQTQKKPNQTNGRYLFSLSLFSNAANVSITDNPNLPLLTLENLNLLITDIS